MIDTKNWDVVKRCVSILEHGTASHGDICVEFYYDNKRSYNSISFKKSVEAFHFVSDIVNCSLDYKFTEIYGTDIEFKTIYKKHCPFTNSLMRLAKC